MTKDTTPLEHGHPEPGHPEHTYPESGHPEPGRPGSLLDELLPEPPETADAADTAEAPQLPEPPQSPPTPDEPAGPAPADRARYLTGPAPTPIIIGLVGLLFLVATVVWSLTDLSVNWGLVTPVAVVLIGVVIIGLGLLGLRRPRD